MATTDLLPPPATRARTGRPAGVVRAAVVPLVGILGALLVLVGAIAASAGSHAPSALAVDAAWALVGLGAIVWSATARRR